MAILKNHNIEQHDIHKYSSEWNRQSESNQISYNDKCQGNFLNWSGVSLRPRSYCRVVPEAFRQIFTQPFVEDDINFWNTCNPCCVLLTPKHALICQHYRGTHERVDEYYTFMGKSGTKYTRKVIGVTLNIGSDHTLLEFDQEVPQRDVAAYSKIADARYIGEGTEFWIHDCNGKAFKMKYGKTQLDASMNASSFSYGPIIDGINDGIDRVGWPVIFVGDSGSPCFVVDSYDRTILIGLMWGGMQINAKEIDNINVVISKTGYMVEHVKINAKIADINQDGKVDSTDMAIIMNSWGSGDLAKDLNKDGKVDAADMSIMLSSWGAYDMSQNVILPSITNSSSSSLSTTKRI